MILAFVVLQLNQALLRYKLLDKLLYKIELILFILLIVKMLTNEPFYLVAFARRMRQIHD